ncbi:unnamed protein product, partial [Cuscuta campestris]
EPPLPDLVENPSHFKPSFVCLEETFSSSEMAIEFSGHPLRKASLSRLLVRSLIPTCIHNS